ncbi:MAG: FixH family protein [Catenulispora sp.]
MLLFLVAGLLIPGAGPASAHATVVSTSPGDGQVLVGAPSAVSVTFDEPVELEFGALRVFDPSGARVDDGDPAHPAGRGDTVTVRVRGGLPQGTYTASWRVISADSHPVAGAFTFSVGAASATSVNQGTLNAHGSAIVGAVYGVVRGVAYLAFAILIGAATFLFVCWPAGAMVTRARRLLAWSWTMLTIASCAVLALQGPYAAGFGLGSALDFSVLHQTLQTRLGTALAIRLGLLVLAAGALAWTATRLASASAARRRVVGSGCGTVALGLAWTWAWADHAGTGSQVALAVPMDVLHLCTMAAWLGGLVLLAAVLLRPGTGADRRDIARAVPRFSAIALGCVSALVVTGGYQAWRQIGSVPALTGTVYGRLLLLKLLGFTLLIGLGYLARTWNAEQFGSRRLAPVLIPGSGHLAPEALAQLRRSVAVETAVAAAVLALTAALVNTEPGREAYTAPVSTTVAFDTHGPHGAGTIEVVVTPARLGTDSFHLSVLDPAGGVEVIPELRAALRLPSHAIGPLPVPLTEAEPGHYTATAPIPVAGSWQLVLTVRTSDIDETTVTVPFDIR